MKLVRQAVAPAFHMAIAKPEFLFVERSAGFAMGMGIIIRAGAAIPRGLQPALVAV